MFLLGIDKLIEKIVPAIIREIKNEIREMLLEDLPKIINNAMMREIDLEDRTSKPGEVIREKRDVNIISMIASQMARNEGAMRGMQADVDKIMLMNDRFVKHFLAIAKTSGTSSKTGIKEIS